MIDIREINNCNSQIEILNSISEVNIFTTLLDYNKSKPQVTVECNPNNYVKLLDDLLVYSNDGYRHYISLKDILVITLKKAYGDYENTDKTAYLYDSLTNYNNEKAIEVPYFGEVKEQLYNRDKVIIIEDKEYLHLLNVDKLSAVVLSNDGE
jgi:hypothetical protein